MQNAVLFHCSNFNCNKELGTQDKISFGLWRGIKLTLCLKCSKLLDKTLGFTNASPFSIVEEEGV